MPGTSKTPITLPNLNSSKVLNWFDRMSMNMELDGDKSDKSEPNQVPSVPLNPVPAGSLPQAMQNASNPQLETVIILTI